MTWINYTNTNQVIQLVSRFSMWLIWITQIQHKPYNVEPGIHVTDISYTDTTQVIQCVTRLSIVIPYYTTSLNAQIIKVYVHLSSPLVFNFFALHSVWCLTNRQSLNNQVWLKTMNLLHVFQFQMISAMYRREGEWMSNIC